jgi:hypothetical protein
MIAYAAALSGMPFCRITIQAGWSTIQSRAAGAMLAITTVRKHFPAIIRFRNAP